MEASASSKWASCKIEASSFPRQRIPGSCFSRPYAVRLSLGLSRGSLAGICLGRSQSSKLKRGWACRLDGILFSPNSHSRAIYDRHGRRIHICELGIVKAAGSNGTGGDASLQSPLGQTEHDTNGPLEDSSTESPAELGNGGATSQEEAEAEQEAEEESEQPGTAATPKPKAVAPKIVRRNLRGGQYVEYKGSVVLIGDMNRESGVVAGGDVIVLGRLRGEVHAGCLGDRSASILALEMSPQRLRIADVVVFGPSGPPRPYPEQAKLTEDGTIDITPYAHFEQLVGEGILPHSAKVPKRSGPFLGPARNALITSVYISLVGLAALLFPVRTFGLLFDTGAMTPGWIQVGGVLALVFGVNYGVTAWLDRRRGTLSLSFYWSTAISRVMLFLLFCVLVAARTVQPALLVLGGVNFVGALAMYASLRQVGKAEGEPS